VSSVSSETVECLREDVIEDDGFGERPVVDSFEDGKCVVVRAIPTVRCGEEDARIQ